MHGVSVDLSAVLGAPTERAPWIYPPWNRKKRRQPTEQICRINAYFCLLGFLTCRIDVRLNIFAPADSRCLWAHVGPISSCARLRVCSSCTCLCMLASGPHGRCACCSHWTTRISFATLTHSSLMISWSLYSSGETLLYCDLETRVAYSGQDASFSPRDLFDPDDLVLLKRSFSNSTRLPTS